MLAIIKHNNLLYILIYKQKYRLHNENANNKILILNIDFYITNLNNEILNLIIDKKYTLTKFVFILLTTKKSLRKHAQNIVNLINLLSYHIFYIKFKNIKFEKIIKQISSIEINIAFTKVNKHTNFIDSLSRKTRKAFEIFVLLKTYSKKIIARTFNLTYKLIKYKLVKIFEFFFFFFFFYFFF